MDFNESFVLYWWESLRLDPDRDASGRLYDEEDEDEYDDPYLDDDIDDMINTRIFGEED